MENIKYIILRNVIIVDSQSKYHNKKTDILIEDGIIKKIDKKIDFKKPFFEIKTKNLHVSPGWVDLHARFGEPGFEHRETVKSGLKAAAKGGFTNVVVMPSTNPPIEKKADIKFLIEKSKNNIVDILPTGSITKNREQKEITEMYDMHINGAVAFTDDKKTIQNTMLMNIALEYVKNFKGLIMTTCLDEDLHNDGQVNEGIISTTMGLPPSPEIAETLMVIRDLNLLKYTNSRLHISTISSLESIKQIKKGKKDNLTISCDIAAHQLILTDERCKKFDSNFKVIPPLRNKKTQLSLIDNIINGTIDSVCSDHTPIEIESKKCEFQKAKFGIIGLETVFPIINTVLKKKIKLSGIIDLISTNPRKNLDIVNPKIEENERANMTLFDPSKEWVYRKEDIASISKNTPFINYKFTGKVIGIINNQKVEIHN